MTNATHIYSVTTDVTKKLQTGPLNHDLLFGVDASSNVNQGHIFQAGQLDGNIKLVDLYDPGFVVSQFSGPTTPLGYDWQNIQQVGVYAQDQLALPWDFHLLGGVRYQYLRSSYVASFPAYGIFDTPSNLYANTLTPRGALLWRPLPWFSTYVSYTQSYGFSCCGYVEASGQEVPPSRGKQYEGGAKTSFLNDHLTASAAVFYLTKTNVPTPDLNNPAFVLAAGEVRSQGVEFDLKGEVLPGWNVVLNYAYTDARVTKASSLASAQPGSRFNGTPFNLVNLWTTYEFQTEKLAGVKVGGGMTLSDAIPYEPTGGATTQALPGYAVFDLMTAYKFLAWGSTWTAQLNLTNLFNRRYFSEAQVNGFPTAGNYASFTGIYGPRRSLLGTVRAEF